uniref:Uncharacterized protein n=1 Tax=viral metagenome TaxID=1070528 RepID=A0A6C0JXY0_9ZZZZ
MKPDLSIIPEVDPDEDSVELVEEEYSVYGDTVSIPVIGRTNTKLSPLSEHLQRISKNRRGSRLINPESGGTPREDRRTSIFRLGEERSPASLRESKYLNFSGEDLINRDDIAATRSSAKTMKIRGKEYTIPVIPGSDTIEVCNDEQAENEALKLVSDAHNDALALEKRARCGYVCCIGFEYMAGIMVILLGVLIGIFTIQQNNTKDPLIYTASCLGFIVSGIQGLTMFFQFKDRGLVHKQGSKDCAKLRRRAIYLESANMSTEKRISKAMEILDSLDEIDLMISRVNPPPVGTSKDLNRRVEIPKSDLDPETVAHNTINSPLPV